MCNITLNNMANILPLLNPHIRYAKKKSFLFAMEANSALCAQACKYTSAKMHYSIIIHWARKETCNES